MGWTNILQKLFKFLFCKFTLLALPWGRGRGLHDFSPCLLWTLKPLLQHFVTGMPPHPFSDRFGDREVILSLVLSPFLKISEGLTWWDLIRDLWNCKLVFGHLFKDAPGLCTAIRCEEVYGNCLGIWCLQVNSMRDSRGVKSVFAMYSSRQCTNSLFDTCPISKCHTSQ